MKKILTLLMFSGIISGIHAQRLYLQGGVNFANITQTTEGRTEDNNVLTTFNVGLITRIKRRQSSWI